MKEHPDQWTEVIRPQSGLLEIPFKEVRRYGNLLGLLVKRDFVATNKQAILGPLWFFIQSILATVMFVVVFGRIAGVSADGVPTNPMAVIVETFRFSSLGAEHSAWEGCSTSLLLPSSSKKTGKSFMDSVKENGS
ncbi:hypothetical protein [Niabella hirudinis]|uniref:hypothetical protein n=1 Tax=Niabella hirudinis TaxID=1285929 RepID=UPI003EBCB843